LELHRLLRPAVTILRYLFVGGDAPSCLKSADVNDSGTVEIDDAVFFLTFLFQRGVDPAEPFVVCGEDATADGLTCDSYAPCER
jgi:hypothetical protein